jgi:hypothetical protein
MKIAIIALMMEAARTSETLVNFYQTTRCYNPEDSNLQPPKCCILLYQTMGNTQRIYSHDEMHAIFKRVMLNSV